MGKGREKKQRHHQRHSHRPFFQQEDEEDFHSLPSSAFSSSNATLAEEEDENVDELEEEEENYQTDEYPPTQIPSKFLLYQQSVQSPKGDISYLLNFFLMYVGGRLPLHFQEDFCGTALLSTQWLRSDPRRTAVGLDLELEALQWCLENNIDKVGADGYSRISLFHGNVLNPLEAKWVKHEPHELIKNVSLKETNEESSDKAKLSSIVSDGSALSANDKLMRNLSLPARDIVCAFNYSCCCLHTRVELVSYFKHARDALSRKGGIFVMDLYGGTSSEHKLRLRRKFANFTYIWEQDEFDIVQRKTRISLHFHFPNQQKKMNHAFSYSWRLWSLPEIRDCLDDAGFRSVHIWLRQMPDTAENKCSVGFGADRDIKYQEMKQFEQHDAWNAYIVGVA